MRIPLSRRRSLTSQRLFNHNRLRLRNLRLHLRPSRRTAMTTMTIMVAITIPNGRKCRKCVRLRSRSRPSHITDAHRNRERHKFLYLPRAQESPAAITSIAPT